MLFLFTHLSSSQLGINYHSLFKIRHMEAFPLVLGPISLLGQLLAVALRTARGRRPRSVPEAEIQRCAYHWLSLIYHDRNREQYWAVRSGGSGRENKFGETGCGGERSKDDSHFSHNTMAFEDDGIVLVRMSLLISSGWGFWHPDRMLSAYGFRSKSA